MLKSEHAFAGRFVSKNARIECEARTLLTSKHRPMLDATSPLPFDEKDHLLLSVEDVSKQLQVSRAFVRLCLEAGCPSHVGRLSAADLLDWLFDNYELVRRLAGLTPFVEVEGVARNAACRLKMANALFTLLEFSESRTSNSEAKQALRIAYREVEQAIERA